MATTDQVWYREDVELLEAAVRSVSRVPARRGSGRKARQDLWERIVCRVSGMGLEGGIGSGNMEDSVSL